MIVPLPGRLDRRKASRCGNRAGPAGRFGELLQEGIVATGIEDDERDVGVLFHVADDFGDVDRAVAHRALARYFDIDGEKVVGALELQAVAGIIEKRGCRSRQRGGEFVERLQRLLLRRVESEMNLETEALQPVRDGLRVVERVGKPGSIGVSGVADDERHPLFGFGGV